jgi:FkbM family methyltransferase
MSKFIITGADYGPMIVNALDEGVGWQLMCQGNHEPEVVNFGLKLIDECHKNYHKQVRVLDVGANLGSCAIPWAKYLRNRGHVIAYEPQEILYYNLCGNIVINNVLNAKAVHAVVGNEMGTTKIPQMNHNIPGNYGGLHLRQADQWKKEGNQPISYKTEHMVDTPMVHLDHEGFDRVDILKIDVEGMELDVLHGAENTIWKTLPVIIVEFIHCGEKPITEFLYLDYEFFQLGAGNLVCVPTNKPKLLDFVKSCHLKDEGGVKVEF